MNNFCLKCKHCKNCYAKIVIKNEKPNDTVYFIIIDYNGNLSFIPRKINPGYVAIGDPDSVFMLELHRGVLYYNGHPVNLNDETFLKWKKDLQKHLRCPYEFEQDLMS